MGVDRFSFIYELVVSQHQGTSGCNHAVCDYENLPFHRRTAHVFHLDYELVVVAVFAVGGNEGILCLVKNLKHSVVKGKAGPHDRGYHDLVCKRLALRYAQRGLDFSVFVSKGLADFHCGVHAYPFHVLAETHAVFLDFLVPEFCQVLANDGASFAEINDFHNMFVLDCNNKCNVFAPIIEYLQYRFL